MALTDADGVIAQQYAYEAFAQHLSGTAAVGTFPVDTHPFADIFERSGASVIECMKNCSSALTNNCLPRKTWDVMKLISLMKMPKVN